MTTPTPPDFRALCAELSRLDGHCVVDCTDEWADAMFRLRAALEAQPEPVGPTDEELLELMPETMLDEFRYAAKVCSDATGGQVKPGIFRVCLNHTALEYAHAVLSRWGRPAIEPIPVSERLPEPKDCDAEGLCWWWDPLCEQTVGWTKGLPQYCNFRYSHWLPHWALPIPSTNPENQQ